MAKSITISDIAFTAINKWKNHGTYQHITFSSVTSDGQRKELSAYKSKSEMGFWRLFVYLESNEMARYYKGQPRNATMSNGTILRNLMGVDYVQQSFINLELQKYFNDVLDSLPEVQESDEAVKYSGETELAASIKREIDNESRMEKIEPFYSYFLKVENRCAIVNQTRDENLSELSTILKTTFPTIGKPELVYKDYVFKDTEVFRRTMFRYGGIYVTGYDDTIDLHGDIYKVKLGEVNGKEILLNFILYSLNTSVSENTIAPFKVLNKLAPIFLTTNDDCTSYGVNANYILAGNYICKILDYTQQCLPKNRVCTHKYSWLGGIYDNIFPYTEPEIQELIHLKDFHKHNDWLEKAHLKRVHNSQAAGKRTRRYRKKTLRKKRRNNFFV
jgi:hypothetical protein